jgi:sulfate transport system ATP-binding protein
LTVGGQARLELEREDDGATVEAEMPVERFRQQRFTEGESLLVQPRRAQVFLGAA